MPKKLFIGILFLSSAAFGCLWDRDTIGDEAAANPTRFDILIGQFAHHGSFYYETRIESLMNKRVRTTLEDNDLAVAYMRIGDYDESVRILDEILAKEPDYYPSVSNRGVLAKKEGDFEKAIEYIGRALKLNPEGHMGIGDWYLKMLEWRLAVEENPAYRGHFIEDFDADWLREQQSEGRFGSILSIEEGEGRAERDAHIARLFALLKNDQTFADGYFVLARELYKIGDFKMTEIALSRAKELGHPKMVEVDLIQFAYQLDWLPDLNMYGPSNMLGDEKIHELLSIGGKWLTSYQEKERERIVAGQDVSFAVMKKETDIHDEKLRPKPRLRNTKYGRVGMSLMRPNIILLGTGGLIAFIALVSWTRLRRRRRLSDSE
jgi:tetratricopeptide (TPR) repeat protein